MVEGPAAPTSPAAGDTSFWEVDHAQIRPRHRGADEPLRAGRAARNLAAAQALIPAVTHHDRADVTAIEDLRRAWKAEAGNARREAHGPLVPRRRPSPARSAPSRASMPPCRPDGGKAGAQGLRPNNRHRPSTRLMG